MKKDPQIFLKHILESIEEIENYTKDKTETNFGQNSMMQDAVIRRIGIIGQAVKNLPLHFRKKHPETEWKKIAGMRDIVIHNYFGINTKLVWETIRKDIPKLKKQIEKLILNYKI